MANFLLNYALITGMFGLPKLGLMGIGLVTAIVANPHGPGSWRCTFAGIRLTTPIRYARACCGSTGRT